MERRVDITNEIVTTEVEFSYSVEWTEEKLDWKDRLSKYTGSRLYVPTSFEIHWLSIINSFVLVLLLTAFLTIIMLRILKNDFSRYMELDDEALEEEEVRIIYINYLIASFSQSILTMFSSFVYRTQQNTFLLYIVVWLEINSW